MVNKPSEHTCKNCGNKFQGNYCNICGQKVITSRFTFKVFFIDAIINVLSLERGFFYTIHQLIKDPGKVIKDILNGRTRIYFNPIKFLIIIAGISALLVLVAKSFDHSIEFSNELTRKLTEQPQEMPPFALKIQSLMKDYINVLMIFMVPFYALGFKILFSGKDLYYTEHLIIVCYSFAIGTLFNMFTTLLFLIVPIPIGIDMALGMMIMLATYTYFYYKITKRNFLGTVLSTALAMIIGLITMLITFMVLTYIIVLILKRLGIL